MNQNNSALVYNTKTFSWRDGKRWFDGGVELFKHAKNYWYLLCLLVGLLMLLVGQLSDVLMTVVVMFVSPLVTAFVMKLCHLIAAKQTVIVSQIWQLIMSHLSAFLILGALSALLSLLFQQVHIQLLVLAGLPLELTEEMVKQMSGKEVLVRALINIATNLPVALALSFSPALILFNQTAPLTAMKQSVFGVLRAWKSFVVLVLLFMLMFFGVMVLASVIMAVLSTVLGANSHGLIQLIILFFAITVAGIGLCAQYLAFIDIFQIKSAEENQATEVYTEI
jgi:hypothetical protein